MKNEAISHLSASGETAQTTDHFRQTRLLEVLPVPVGVVDVFGKLRYANLGMRQALTSDAAGTMEATFSAAFAFAQSLDWNVVWTELLVSRHATHLVRRTGSNAEAAMFDAQMLLVDADEEPMALISLHPVADQEHVARDRGREDLALAKILIDAIPAAIFAKDRQGRYVLCNQQFEGFIGLRRNQLLGRGVFELWERDLAELYHAADTSLFETPGMQIYETKVKHGDGSRRDVVFHKATFNDVNGEVAGMVGVMLDVTKRKQAEEKSRYLAQHDMLTGLPNRHWLMAHLPRAIARAKKHDSQVAVLFIDIDNFKRINDTFGHSTGDELLQMLAERIRCALRDNDCLVRLSGDEFLVLLHGVDDHGEAEQVAQRIQQALASPFMVQKRNHRVAASIGISVYPLDGSDGETLLKNADIAMYVAKQEGKNTYRSFSATMCERVREQREMEQALTQAVQHDEFVMVYQPRVDPASGMLVGLEALIRWQHPERGMVPPAEFIPLAEQSSLIIDIGKCVIDKVCAQIAHWSAQHLQPVPVSMNISARHFNEGGIASCLQDAIQKHRIATQLIEVEITESAMTANIESVLSEMQALADLGIKVHLDDFGTGYSSLALLHTLNVDVLKIDRSFTAQLASGGKGRIFFEAMVSMAKALRLRIIVEGVETVEQLRALKSLNCDEIQGYLISPPVSAGRISEVLSNPDCFSGVAGA